MSTSMSTSRTESRSEVLRPSEQPDTKPRASDGRRTRPWRVTSKKVLARKWRPTFFLLPGAKKVGGHKSSQINGLCLETQAPSTGNGAFWSSKKRHIPPFLTTPPGFVRRLIGPIERLRAIGRTGPIRPTEEAH